MNANLKHEALESVRRYYGEVLTSSNDLKTGACCATDSSPEWLRSLIAEVLTATRYRPHFEVMGDKSRHFGRFDCAPSNNAAGGAAAAACC
jgi:hypothetical protein